MGWRIYDFAYVPFRSRLRSLVPGDDFRAGIGVVVIFPEGFFVNREACGYPQLAAVEVT